ncbi:MAG: hypothetical protein K8R68_08535, partial [Bacteroidales bacterium]|nr:hypothetical protein [Bacteroidales bacterium]
MKVSKTFLFPVFIFFLFQISKTTTAQILISTGTPPEDMVENIVGAGVEYSNVQYTGAFAARGT